MKSKPRHASVGPLKRVRYLLEYFLFRMFTTALDLVGPRTAMNVADAIAGLLTRWVPEKWTRSHVVRENVGRAYPELDEEGVDRIARGMWSHFVLLLIEIAQVSRRMSRRNVNDFIQFRGDWQNAEQLLKESGRPVIQLTGHLGNWEVGGIIFGHRDVKMGVVARILDNPYLNDWFTRLREQSGHQFLSKNHDLPRMVEIIEAGGRLAMLCDQDAGPKGVFVPFLGKPASTFRTIALLAIEHGAYVVVGYSCRIPNDLRRDGWFKFELGCMDVIDATEYDDPSGVDRLTTRFTNALEAAVRRFPEQYFWLHRRWKTEPGSRAHRPPRKRAAAA